MRFDQVTPHVPSNPVLDPGVHLNTLKNLSILNDGLAALRCLCRENIASFSRDTG